MRRSFKDKSGFTLVEILAAIGVILILATVIVVSAPTIIAKAEQAKCMNNMRQLHAAFASYVQDQNHWPQEPQSLSDSADSSELATWWKTELLPYGAIERIWYCPTISRLVATAPAENRPQMHYSPTMFDDQPQTPYRWPTQPWLIEIGNAHGHGSLISFPDGSIRPMDDVVPRR